MSKNLNLFKKLEPGTQFHCERISSSDQPSHSTRGSEAEPTTNSRYSSFRDWKRSLSRKSLRRAFRYLRINGAAPLSFVVRYQARKDIPHFLVPHRVPRHGSAQVSHSFSKPVALQIRHSSTLISRTLAADLSTDHRLSITLERWERDCISTSRWTLGRRSTDNR